MAPEGRTGSQYDIHIEQARGVAIGDGAQVIINQAHPPEGIPFQAPPLPPHFVPRPEVTNALKSRLLADAPGDSGILVISAIHGLGGIGKSVLAAALCHDEAIQARFSDGVLWATLGQQPEELLSQLNDWIVNELHDYNYRPTTVEAASSHLRTLLQEKAILLVVDDAWDSEHAKPFLVGGPRCQVLITTRRADVADEVGASLHELDVMTPAQALDLLARRIGRSLEDDEQQEALALAKAMGYLPLALELVAGRVARGMSWTDLRAVVEKEVVRLKELESPRRRWAGEIQLEASLNLSLELLHTENEKAWNAFAWLGVLPEDVIIAAPLAATLWDIPQNDASDALELLWNDALLLPGTPVLVREQKWHGYRVHDLLHDVARHQLTADKPQGIGVELPHAHAALLARYQTQTEGGIWSTLRDDGYIHDHLAWHMEKAGWGGALDSLLEEETAEEKNAWYEARERLNQIPGYLEDVARAWRAAEACSAPGLECRYALITASQNSMARNIPPTLLAELVKHDLWNPTQGLAYVRQASEHRAEILAELIPHLPQSLLREALAIAKETPLERQRAEALIALSTHLPEPLLREALLATWQITNSDCRSKALLGLAPHLPESLLPEALSIALQIPNDNRRLNTLYGLAPHLPEQLLWEALAAARQTGGPIRHPIALLELRSQLPKPLRGKVIQEAILPHRTLPAILLRVLALALLLPLGIVGLALFLCLGIVALVVLIIASPLIALSSVLPHARIWLSKGWVRLASFLPEHLQDKAMKRALLVIEGSIGYSERVRVQTAVFDCLPDDLMRAALTAIQGVCFEWHLVEALAGLVPHLPEDLRKDALTIALEIDDEHQRSDALARLAPHLPNSLLEEALTSVRTVGDREEQIVTLTGLAFHLPEQLRGEALQQVIASAQEIENKRQRKSVLLELTFHLQEQPDTAVLEFALSLARETEDMWLKALVLDRLAPCLPESLLEQALALAQQVQPERGQARAMVGLAPCLPKTLQDQVLQQALAIAQGIKDKGERAETLVELAPHLSETLRKTALQQVLDEVREVQDKRQQASILVGLGPHLSGKFKTKILRQAYAAALSIADKEQRARALGEIVEQLPGRLRGEAYRQTLSAIQGVSREEMRPKLLSTFALHLHEPLKDEIGQRALAAAQSIRDEYLRAVVLGEIVPDLPEVVGTQALQAIQNIESEEARAETLAKFALHLPTSLLLEALKVALGIRVEHSQGPALAALAPRLIGLPPESMHQLWMKILHSFITRTRQELLTDLRMLALILVVVGGPDAVAETFQAIQDVGRWWP